jgi:hypothetical protein
MQDPLRVQAIFCQTFSVTHVAVAYDTHFASGLVEALHDLT